MREFSLLIDRVGPFLQHASSFLSFSQYKTVDIGLTAGGGNIVVVDGEWIGVAAVLQGGVGGEAS